MEPKNAINKVKQELEHIITDVWPKTKQELQLVAKNTQAAIDEGEKYLRATSQQGLLKAKKIALTISREKMYYALGKLTASISVKQLSANKKISTLIEEIKKISREINKTK